MTTTESLAKYIAYKESKGYGTPIFRILLFEHPDREQAYNGKPSGFPDLGCSADMGFYFDVREAVLAMNENVADIREGVYNAGFILCHFSGLYQDAGTEARMYFVWDKDRGGFFQADEPKIFAHVGY